MTRNVTATADRIGDSTGGVGRTAPGAPDATAQDKPVTSRHPPNLALFPGAVIDRSERASPQVLHLLRAAIIDFRLAPNQPISENEIAEALGISRTPVREAFLRLAEEGLLLPYPQLGTFVAPISRSGLMEAQFLREAVECAMARKAAALTTPGRAMRLRHLLEAHQASSVAGDQNAFHKLDEDTHHEICVQSGNAGIWGVVAQARGHLDRARRLSLPDASNAQRVLNQHADIIDAIAKGDETGAETTMRQHLRSLLDLLDQHQQKYPAYFTLSLTQQQPRRSRKK
jgi:GntR family transcriptional regulator, rspAB operon transcriptional repressor